LDKRLFSLILAGCASEQILSGEVEIPVPIPNPAEIKSSIVEDRFRQSEKPTVDILWVVDNSGSMAQEQSDLSLNFPAFMNYFLGSNLNYHIGVVSTDLYNPLGNGQLIQYNGVRWIDTETHDPLSTFSGMAQIGTFGSGQEQGVGAAFAALELQEEVNVGFIRPDAPLNIIVVSDENDYSNTITVDEFANYLNGMETPERPTAFSSIVAGSEMFCESISSLGTDYIELSKLTGGIYQSICGEWISTLERLGLETAGLKVEYFLSRRPVQGTINITILLDDITFEYFEVEDWIYSDNRNSITFLKLVPYEDSEVVITYEELAR
jgi:hypothetical protein